MRFCFSIRDLFWLTFVAALATGWWLDRCDLAKKLDVYQNPTYNPFGGPLPHVVGPPLPPPDVTVAPDYDHAKVTKAVKDYLLNALRTDDPFSGLQSYLEKLTTDGWPEADIDAVRSKCERALSDICDIPILVQ